MTNMEKLLAALEDCGEAAAFYKGQALLKVNGLFASLLEMEREALEGMPIIEICNQESIEMIKDFIRRRAHGDPDVPVSYNALFRSSSNPRIPLHLIIIRTKNTDGALLVLAEKA
jgi:hypothetical protein